MTQYLFFRTLWYGSLRRSVVPPPGHYLLPFSSWYAARPEAFLRVPDLPQGFRYVVDCGGFRYTRTGQYPYRFRDYLGWCQALRPAPLWVAMPDWVGMTLQSYQGWRPVPSPLLLLADVFSSTFGLHTPAQIHQVRTAFAGYAIWDLYRDAVPCWVPLLQGGCDTSDYTWAAHFMKPLILEMQRYYGSQGAYRVGIGSLLRRTSREIQEIVAAVSAILPGLPLHCFGMKLRHYQGMRAAFPAAIPEISSDSSEWEGQRVRGSVPGRKAWQESGLRQLAFGYERWLPIYEEKLRKAWSRLSALEPMTSACGEEPASVLAALETFLPLRSYLAAAYQGQPDLLVDL